MTASVSSERQLFNRKLAIQMKTSLCSKYTSINLDPGPAIESDSDEVRIDKMAYVTTKLRLEHLAKYFRVCGAVHWNTTLKTSYPSVDFPLIRKESDNVFQSSLQKLGKAQLSPWSFNATQNQWSTTNHDSMRCYHRAIESQTSLRPSVRDEGRAVVFIA